MDVKIKLFADGADLQLMEQMRSDHRVAGFTTNPTLMRKAGVSDYEKFGLRAAAVAAPLPISFEVFADDEHSMIQQAHYIAGWRDNVYVKIPVTNTLGEPTTRVIQKLTASGVKVNITAIMTDEQVTAVRAVLNAEVPAVVSVFAGRVADAGVDPIPTMQRAKRELQDLPSAELLWASPREILNVVQAQESGCDIITMTTALWEKLDTLGKNLSDYSLETVKMFHTDAREAGFTL